MKSRLIIISLCIHLFSCNYIVKSQKSQLYYQSRDTFLTNTDYKIIKFNDKALQKVIDQSNKKYILLLHCNPYCYYIQNKFKEYKRFGEIHKDSVLYIPIVHDYLYNIKRIVNDTNNYNTDHNLYVTDCKVYGKGLNPNANYVNQFLAKHIDTSLINRLYDRNVYFKKNETYVMFQLGYELKATDNMKSLFEQSEKIEMNSK